MKIKNHFLITIALLCLISITAAAKDISGFSVKTSGKNSFVLQVPNLEQTQIQIILKDAFGEVLFNEKQFKNNLEQRKYNLRKLPSGSYTLYVVYDSVIKIQPIIKVKEALEIKDEKLETVFRPVFRQHSEYLDLTMLCLSDLKILVEIKDSEGHVVYSKINQPGPTLKNRFNMSSLEEGEYTFSVKVMDSGLIQIYKESFEWSPAKSDM